MPNGPVTTVRPDLFLLALAKHGVETHLQPRIPQLNLWDTMGLGDVAHHAIRQAGVPEHEIEHVRLGQVNIPVKVLYGLAQYFFQQNRSERART